jgi:hypothetical protein
MASVLQSSKIKAALAPHLAQGTLILHAARTRAVLKLASPSPQDADNARGYVSATPGGLANFVRNANRPPLLSNTQS